MVDDEPVELTAEEFVEVVDAPDYHTKALKLSALLGAPVIALALGAGLLMGAAAIAVPIAAGLALCSADPVVIGVTESGIRIGVWAWYTG